MVQQLLLNGKYEKCFKQVNVWYYLHKYADVYVNKIIFLSCWKDFV